jgi:hypothetical protein
MNNLSRKKIPMNRHLHDESMFSYITSAIGVRMIRSPDENIAVGPHAPTGPAPSAIRLLCGLNVYHA